ncbi:hypothetical protein [Mongoliitalea daihaiensis]|uniref:hypothetical protein n=1 Tax=Mongoliitalea daihaiensis TaxID=2782006 RepID=UPI001F350FD6|nr:hypothetical protein [Mongoliitalea daihaiensis]UJP66595.1 hypothetical protein IPZ59_08380 [Mongoliitalea daihaiensis]
MIKLTALLFAFAFPFTVFSQSGTLATTQKEKQNLKGPVKEVLHTTFEPMQIGGDSTTWIPYDFFGFHNYRLKFDNRGLLTERIDYKLQDNELKQRGIWNYTYDEKDRVVEEVYLYESLSTIDTASFSYTYLNDSSTSIFEKRNGVPSSTYHYNLSKSTEEFTSVNADSSFIQKTFSEIDDRNRVTRKEDYSNGTRIRSLTLNTYHEQQFLTPAKSLQSYGKGNQVSLYENELDEQGNVISEKITAFHTGDSKTTTYSYLYDDMGNWIEKGEYVDKILRKIVKRSIDYYTD